MTVTVGASFLSLMDDAIYRCLMGFFWEMAERLPLGIMLSGQCLKPSWSRLRAELLSPHKLTTLRTRPSLEAFGENLKRLEEKISIYKAKGLLDEVPSLFYQLL